MSFRSLLYIGLAGPAMADTVSCDLAGTAVRFDIDRAQFAPAIDMAEPQRRRITHVKMGQDVFTAEPVMLGDVRGFWTLAPDGSDVMMIMQADGQAVYDNPATGTRLTGTCEVLQ